MTRRTIWSSDQDADLTELRSCLDWVADFPAQAAQQALDDVDQAYRNWWNPDHQAGPPTFERRSSQLSFRLPGQAVEVRHLDRKWSEVWVPKAGWVRFRRHRSIDGMVRSATFTFTPATGWTVSFGIAAKTIQAPPNDKPGCGVDFGVSCSAFVSTEDEPRMKPSSLTPGEVRRLLGLEQRKARQITWAKKQNAGRYSKRLRRTINQIAALKALEARRRLDFTHKLTADLAKNHGWVGIENLRVKSMSASAKGTVGNPGTNVAQKAGLNREIRTTPPVNAAASCPTSAPNTAPSSFQFQPPEPASPAPSAGSGTLTTGPDADECSPASTADTGHTQTRLEPSMSRCEQRTNFLPVDRRSAARAGQAKSRSRVVERQAHP